MDWDGTSEMLFDAEIQCHFLHLNTIAIQGKKNYMSHSRLNAYTTASHTRQVSSINRRRKESYITVNKARPVAVSRRVKAGCCWAASNLAPRN